MLRWQGDVGGGDRWCKCSPLLCVMVYISQIFDAWFRLVYIQYLGTEFMRLLNKFCEIHDFLASLSARSTGCQMPLRNVLHEVLCHNRNGYCLSSFWHRFQEIFLSFAWGSCNLHHVSKACLHISNAHIIQKNGPTPQWREIEMKRNTTVSCSVVSGLLCTGSFFRAHHIALNPWGRVNSWDPVVSSCFATDWLRRGLGLEGTLLQTISASYSVVGGWFWRRGEE